MATKTSKIDTARRLATSHLEIDPTVQKVFLLESENDLDEREPIRLLEVVEGTIERGIEPISFRPDPARGIDFPSVIVEVSPREFDGLTDHVAFRSEVWHIGCELAAR